MPLGLLPSFQIQGLSPYIANGIDLFPLSCYVFFEYILSAYSPLLLPLDLLLSAEILVQGFSFLLQKIAPEYAKI